MGRILTGSTSRVRIARPSLRQTHAVAASIVVLFAALHLANHLVALGGVAAHIAFMDMARHVYRQRFVEGALLVCAALQIGTGLTMVFRRAWPAKPLMRAQAIAGIVLALFLLVHIGAVLGARLSLRLDTNFYFAAAGLHTRSWAWFFAPYYIGAVVALFAHLGCAVQRRRRAGPAWRWPVAGAAAGLIVGTTIVLCLAGALVHVEIPPAYRLMFEPEASLTGHDFAL